MFGLTKGGAMACRVPFKFASSSVGARRVLPTPLQHSLAPRASIHQHCAWSAAAPLCPPTRQLTSRFLLPPLLRTGPALYIAPRDHARHLITFHGSLCATSHPFQQLANPLKLSLASCVPKRTLVQLAVGHQAPHGVHATTTFSYTQHRTYSQMPAGGGHHNPITRYLFMGFFLALGAGVFYVLWFLIKYILILIVTVAALIGSFFLLRRLRGSGAMTASELLPFMRFLPGLGGVIDHFGKLFALERSLTMRAVNLMSNHPEVIKHLGLPLARLDTKVSMSQDRIALTQNGTFTISAQFDVEGPRGTAQVRCIAEMIDQRPEIKRIGPDGQREFNMADIINFSPEDSTFRIQELSVFLKKEERFVKVETDEEEEVPYEEFMADQTIIDAEFTEKTDMDKKKRPDQTKNERKRRRK